MQKFYLSKSSLKVINTLKSLKNRGLINEIQNLSVKKARIEFSKIRSYFSHKNVIEVLIKKDFKIENIPVRYYRGKNKLKNEILPIMIYFHGGGWVLGNLDTHDQVCCALVNEGKYDLISVDYSLAPEAIFPKAINQGKKILKSISKNKFGLKINNNKIILSGDSAGGNIATVLADYNKNILKAKVVLQVLFYPATHMFSKYDSKNKYDGLILNKKLMKWFEDHYCPQKIRKKYINDPRLSPIKNKKMIGLPDTLIVLAECDPLYDEGLMYGKKLKENNLDFNGIKKINVPNNKPIKPFLEDVKKIPRIIKKIRIKLMTFLKSNFVFL